MKQLIFLFLMLFSVAAFSQNATVDTSFTEVRYDLNLQTGDSAYFEKVTIVYSDGSSNVTDTPIASDTTSLINNFTNRAYNTVKQYAYHVTQVVNKDAVIDFVLNANNTLSSATSTNILKESITRWGATQDSTTWNVVLNGAQPVAGELTVKPNGNAFNLAIGQNTYTIFLVGDSWMRLQGYPQGSYTDLVRLQVQGKPVFVTAEYDPQVIIAKQ